MLKDLGVERIFRASTRPPATNCAVAIGRSGHCRSVDAAGGAGGLPFVAMRAHDSHCASLSSACTASIIVARARSGRLGYVLKDTSSGDFLKAFRTVLSGNPYLSHDLAMRVALINTPARKNPLSELTPRELQTLSLLAKGKPYGDIANELNVSYKTVVNVSSQLKHKLEVRNLPELIRTAVQLLETAG
jgi:DNA-binding NarL/FixJ family response regulator